MSDTQEFALTEAKKELRKKFKELRRSIPTENKSNMDTKMCNRFLYSRFFTEANTLLCYYPIKGEPDILPIIDRALKTGKKVAFPVCDRESKKMTFLSVTDLSQLEDGEYGIPAPTSRSPMISDFTKSVCIVPAMAYDSKFNRLGYGGGYYDRFLSSFGGISVLLIYSKLFCDELITDEYDCPVDVIITEKEELFNEKTK